MAAVLSPGEAHDVFIKWAKEQGIEMNGVAPATFVGRGIGIVAARDLKKGERLVFVPASALISIDSNPVKKHNFPKNLTIHGRLAAYLLLAYDDSHSRYRPWQDIWPSEEDFNKIMPLNWPQKLKDLLPAAAKGQLETDYKALKPFLPADSEKLFTYTWLIVNTRCFYWDYPNLPASRLPKKRQSLTADDCYAMCPFLDYFNHADEGCEPTHDASGYAVTCNQNYKAGEEIYVSYGSHNNDFLLIEYGFILARNKCDDTKLDHLILPKLTTTQSELLKEDGFYGAYTLPTHPPPPHPCHRTQSALRILHLPIRRYTAFISGSDDGSTDQSRINNALKTLLAEYARTIMEIGDEVAELDGEAAGVAEQKDVLARRWRQVREIVREGAREVSG
ncbi:SET domain-containing protein [Lepidopterella palustris CBS 459.81]|uniref:SET domain-containing protein n=1 Tax=Lepidopterella palustris CBS 459.81 TaxID=1314670 RepID=A0A8E2E9J0_9PEZI|nr:SET domain-containing protein [Lepidopterella palustris CBS 459.81]